MKKQSKMKDSNGRNMDSRNRKKHGYWWYFFWTLVTSLLVAQCAHAQQGSTDTQEITVDEELAKNTVIGRIGQGRADINPPFMIFYGDNSQSGRETNLDINEDTGDIKVQGRLDREAKSRYQFYAISTEGKYVNVVINLRDINDNAPVFPESYVATTLTEAASQDVELSLGSAIDPDIGNFSVQRFEIVSGNVDNVFEAVWKEKNGNLILELKVNGMLDYEITPFYSLKIRAYDGGYPPRFGEMTLNISIIDTNDNQPIFNTSRYFARVPENVTVGTSVLQVFATDRDAGKNGEINYYIDRQRSDEKSNFDINALTGVVFVNKPLDYEKKHAYELIVVAHDNGDAKLQTTAVVSVEVSNINDNAPEINVMFLTQTKTGRIPETANEGDYVARISVSDADVESAQPQVNISLTGGDGNFGLTERENIVYLTILAKPLDRELRPHYLLTITATDYGTPRLSSSKTLTLYISDTNDNAPEFETSTYYADIQEVLPPGSSVIKVTAVDRDDGNNSMVTYQLAISPPDTHAEWFQIDNRTGLITTVTRVDCETVSEPRLTVIATDSGSPPLSATATVNVRIHDVNDNQPVFEFSYYNVTVSESEAVGSCILKIHATDPDCGSSAGLRYSIAASSGSSGSAGGFPYPVELEVRPLTGEICLVSRLDYEKRTSYDFPVMARDQDGLETTAMVKVTIEDTNDNHPIFYPRTYSHHLLENAPMDTEVVVVRATDKDSGRYGAITYSISGGNTNDVFRIDSRSGAIRLQKRLPSDLMQYTLVIRAVDGSGLESLEPATVSISILDPSQNPPEFTLSLYKFSIREDVEVSRLVGTVEATTDSPGPESILYSIVSGDPDEFFEMELFTGSIKTAKPLDHDRVPYVLLNIQAQRGDPPSYGQAQVNVSMLDVNDNSPEFAVSSIEIPVKEDTSMTANIYVMHAEDADSGDNGKVQYILDGDASNTFSINKNSGMISLLKPLDHEAVEVHEFQVTAYDNGSPRRQSSVTVKINVQDVNDNSPQFEQESYSFEIVESIETNTRFGSVKATDADSGNNGRVTYLLQNGPHLDTFGIFPNDGGLYNRLPLDRERKESYDIIVIALDNGIPSRSSSISIKIDILDANDNTPEFQEALYVFYIEENQPANAHVGYISALDRDDSDNLHYSIATPNDYFSVVEDGGEVITKKPLDRENIEIHTFTVKVTDSGNPPQSSTTQVKVYILDVNDNYPKFDSGGRYEARIFENQSKGTVVTTVSAEDGDKGENQTISYLFSSNNDNGDAAAFSIHPKTGQITTREVLDHERKASYNFRIVARDGGNPPKETETSIEVSVEDKNETPPEFESGEHVAFTVRENTPTGTIVNSVVAKDKDSGENGRVFYYIVRGNLFSTFGINKTTGQIFVAKPVDYEEASNYMIQIRAMDNSALNPMSNIITVNITVIDENDNPPQFEDDPVIIALRENNNIGSEVYTFSAVDKDSGNYGRVRYEILSQDPVGGWFNIDSQSGELTVGSDIDYETTKQIGLVVKATDQAVNEQDRLFSTVTVLVLIEDTNDNAPIFHTRSRMDLMEDEPINFPIMHIIASDEDSLENGRVSYMITEGNQAGHFNLDSETGLVSIAKSLDRETADLHQLTITARDHGYPQRSSTLNLDVHVVDVNDNAPVFERSVYVVQVDENANIGTSVTSIRATDKDIGTNAELVYILPDGIAGNKFSLEAKTGDIVTNAVLDREQQGSYVITAYVKDSAFPALYDTATVLVTVQDVNDNTPRFTGTGLSQTDGHHVYSLTVPENDARASLHTVTASDADEGDNGRVTYSIVSGNDDNKFSIDATSGRLSCLPLDRESVSDYNLTIRAQDQGGKFSHANVLVTVLDDNDNDPLFEQTSYSASIDESVAPDTSVLRVRAMDADTGVNARITYSLNNAAEGQFKINNVTGLISTAGEFDREKHALYNFEVFATDGGQYGPRTEKVRVEVNIRDVNDNAPVFTQVPFKKEIPATLGIQSIVTTVEAVDADAGENGRVTYALEEPSPYFSLDARTGEIRSKAMLMSLGGTVHRLGVVAQDHGATNQHSVKGMVSINIGDAAGASSLRFNRNSYEVTLPENSPSETCVATTTATFTDGGSMSERRITYSLDSSNDADNTFHIVPGTGKITVYNPEKLDYEQNKRLRLIVLATGTTSSAPTAYDYTTVWVNIQDENDNAPRFAQERYVSAVWEGNDRGTYVTQVSAADADSGDNGRVTYTIIAGNINGAFVIDPPNTGIVKTNVILDREIHSSYKLEIEASDMSRTGIKTSTCILKINVIDLNDNSPQFPQFPPILLQERTELGTMILAVTANDIDLNPIMRYDFAPGGNVGEVFSIDTYSGKLALAKPLDHEERNQYTLNITATDELHETHTLLYIEVGDENDNAPVFSQQSYQIALPELSLPHTPVLAIEATDADAGENARITYSMVGGGSNGFYINATTGVIYTNQTLVFRATQPTVQLVVTASDHGEPARSAVAAVRLQILDINNHAPQFTNNVYSAQVSEAETRGNVVLQVLANDNDDSPENKKIDFSIIGGNEENMFQIGSSTGEILLTGDLDRERTAAYNLQIKANDRGTPRLTSTSIVKIEVKDVNDNAPVFTGGANYAATLNESVPVGSSVVTVHADDKDYGNNGRVQYKIVSGNDDNKFEIDRDSGVVSVRTQLDHETRSNHRLIVSANDSAENQPRHSAFATVTINVTDVNEFDPRFPVLMYFESVRENMPVGTYVFTAHANDKDSGLYGRLKYELLSEQGLFAIDYRTGDVTTAAVFDFESMSQYAFKVMATDEGNRYATVPISITIESDDEYRPMFTKTEYEFDLPGNAKKGFYVGMVEATDQDRGKSGTVLYSFEEPNEYFYINRTLGKIYVAKDLQSEDDATDSTNSEGETNARKRRFAYVDIQQDEMVEMKKRSKRALSGDSVKLTIVASSGQSKSQVTKVSIEILIDRNCLGCAAPSTGKQDGGFVMAGTPLVLTLVFAVIAIITVVVIVIIFVRSRSKRKNNEMRDQSQYGSSIDSFGVVGGVIPPPPIRNLPPPYDEVHFPHHLQMTSASDVSAEDESGRGSAEGEDEDEEIRMINATPLDTQARMPDSGIQNDDDEDAQSEHSAQNHEEYLARLGIKPVVAPMQNQSNNMSNNKMQQSSVESMHQFSDEGGGEGDGLTDIQRNIYSSKKGVVTNGQAGGVGTSKKAVKSDVRMDATKPYHYGNHEDDSDGTLNSKLGSLSSVINSEEEFSGSYNWDYLLDWGPQFQPLADVFTEIARLKDDNIKPKKAPIKTVLQVPNSGAGMHMARGGPPPIITDAPPKAVLMLNGNSNNHHQQQQQHHHPQPHHSQQHQQQHHHNPHQYQQQQHHQQQHQQNHHNQNSHPHHQYQQQQQHVIPPYHLDQQSSSSNPTLASARTSQMTSMASLPKSPISYASTFTSPAMTPDFDPSLSPLQHRSPSFSPIVSVKGVGSAPGSTHGGGSTHGSVHGSSNHGSSHGGGHHKRSMNGQGQRRRRSSGSSRSGAMVIGSSGSEQELQI